MDVLRVPWAAGYSKEQEIEADVNGLRLTAAAGYDPHKATAWMARATQSQRAGARSKPKTPMGEAARAAADAVWDYWATHPSAEERLTRMERAADKLTARHEVARACPPETWKRGLSAAR